MKQAAQPQRHGARRTCTHDVLPDEPGLATMSTDIQIMMVVITTADGHVQGGQRAREPRTSAA